MNHLLFRLRMAPVTPLKYPKSEKVNFLTPILLRTEIHVRSYDDDSDSL
jgi:hypothetical protein